MPGLDDDRSVGADRQIGRRHSVEDLEVGAQRRRRHGARDVAAPRAVVLDVRVVALDHVPVGGDGAAVPERRDRRVRQLDADRRRAHVLEIELEIGGVVHVHVAGEHDRVRRLRLGDVRVEAARSGRRESTP